MIPFTAQMWQQTAALRAAMQEHPFLQELAAGTLPRATFQHYLLQDGHFLKDYGQVLLLAAARAPCAADRCEFLRSASEALAAEQALHTTLFRQFSLDASRIEASEPSPTCLGYGGYLLGLAATASYGALVAALLPCFWVYADLAGALAASCATDNPYADWISAYADPLFAQVADRVRGLVDRAHAAAGRDEQAAMAQAFWRSIRWEYHFWDAAHRQESWFNVP